LIRTAAILHLDGHNPKGALAAAIEARRCGIPVSLDAGTMRDGIAEILPYVTILVASESFARKFSGEKKLENALLRLKETGADVAGITMGKEGSMALDNGRIVRCPAFRIDAVDTTGAGDVFHGAFCVRYLETHDIQESMKFASAVSALKCLQFGGRTGIPDRRQVDEFLNDNFLFQIITEDL
jgi:sugar/nucleoside kinase (ribokinase family)